MPKHHHFKHHHDIHGHGYHHGQKHIVALTGNPNSGKTTIFNSLTGSRQHVGNYAGVTVEKREGVRNFHDDTLHIVDLPGTYSLTAYSEEEKVARRFIIEDAPEVVVEVIDASNIERNLYLAIQILELERPTIFALNMMDVAESRGIKIDDAKLSELFKVPVVRTVGRKNRGMEELLHAVSDAIHHGVGQPFRVDYGEDIEKVIEKLSARLAAVNRELKFPVRWLAVKLLENDQEIIDMVKNLPGSESIVEDSIAAREELLLKNGEDTEITIADYRYRFIGSVLTQVAKFPLLETATTSDKIDKVLTNRVYGLPIFFGLMWLLFNFVFVLSEYPMGLIETGVTGLGNWLGENMAEGHLKSLVVDGIIGGVGGVIVFLPNILLLFLGIAILEDTGYMARVAFIMDRIMRAVGLHGKSFIPLLLGFGCGVPAVMAARTLDNPRDRLVTILVTPFMSCSARLPVYTILIAAFFSEEAAGTVLFSIYLLGIALAIIMARIFRSTLFPGNVDPFVMELPPYHLPTVKNILLHMWERSVLYLKKAGTIILAVSIVVWFLTSYPSEVNYSKDYNYLTAQAEEAFDKEKLEELHKEQAGEKLSLSYAGTIGRAIEPIIKPLGFDWKIGVGLFTGFAAKEVLVSTFGTIYSVGEADETSFSLREKLAQDPVFNSLVAYTLMVFVLIYAPCLAVITVIWRETMSLKWALFTLGYTTVLAWIISFIVYRVGSIFIT